MLLPALYNDYLEPNVLYNNTDFLTNDFIEVMLKALGINQGYALKNLIADYYFREGQLGDLEAMTPGAIDVGWTFFFELTIAQPMALSLLAHPSISFRLRTIAFTCL